MRTNMSRALPIRQMREASGKTYEDVAASLTLLLKRKITPEYVRLLEYRGIGLYEFVRAFSTVYNQPMDAVAAALEKSPVNSLSK